MEKLINACSEYLRWQPGMKEVLERLRENDPIIQAVISDYPRGHIRDRDPALNRWVWQLRDAMDETDEVLGDFEDIKLEEQLNINNKLPKMRSTLSSLQKFGKRAVNMVPNLKRLEMAVKKLAKVSAEVSTFLHLLKNLKQEQHELELQLRKDRETGSLPTNDLIGRGEEKDFVMQWLRKPTNEDPTHISSPGLYRNISILSIVGHGGMGKTTLLQHIYEDVQEEFELKIWVCVSKDFDAKKIITDMLECLNKKRLRLESLVALQESLKAVMQSKKFLLVLDDIWEEDTSKWEKLLSRLTIGSFGSKILITTRMDSVASAIAKVIKKKKEILKIKGLEEDVCLKLLNTHAFDGVDNLDEHKNITDIAALIVKKLSGSPLAAKVIGCLLNSNLDESFWKTILNSADVLNVEREPSHNDMFHILILSVTFLPQPLQNCFAFCGLFQRDHHFDKDDLVRMWIALGFIEASSMEGVSLEDIGARYFDLLVKKSFFDEFNGWTIYYKMHDVLHDLAQSISSEDCFRFMGDNVLSLKIPKNVRHLFVRTENLEVMRLFKDVKNLPSLFVIHTSGDQCFVEILGEIFKASRSIRLLFINATCQERMPEAIKNLRQLRYLNLELSLTQMPRSICRLYNLQFIIYKGWPSPLNCDDFLPSDLSNLPNLRHLGLPWSVFSSVPGIEKLRRFITE